MGASEVEDSCLRWGEDQGSGASPRLASAESDVKPNWITAFLWLAVLPPALVAQELQIHHIDVDQGDATLFVLPNASTLLVDAGLDSRGDEVAAFLAGQGVSHVDAFLATHYDSDHYGGIDKVLDAGVTVGAWYERGERQHLPSSKTSQTQFRQYDSVAVSPIRLMPGDEIDLDPEVSLVVVASNGHVRGAVGKYPIDSLDENAYSVSLLVSYNGFNYFIGGDLTSEVEERIVREAAVGDVDIYKVSHHGSETSSSEAFVRALRPEVAVISAGSHCGYHHPRQAVLDTISAAAPGVTIYQTNRYLCGDPRGGNVPDSLIADVESTEADGMVSIIVGSDSYETRLPARGDTQSRVIERE